MNKQQLLQWSEQAQAIQEKAWDISKRLLLKPNYQDIKRIGFFESGSVTYTWGETAFSYSHKFPIDIIALEGDELDAAIEQHRVEHQAAINQEIKERENKRIEEEKECELKELERLQGKYSQPS